MLMSKSYGNIGGISVCKDCCDRRIGCHDICKDYCEEAAKHNELKKEQRKEAELRNAFCDVKKSKSKSYHRSNNFPKICHKK